MIDSQTFITSLRTRAIKTRDSAKESNRQARRWDQDLVFNQDMIDKEIVQAKTRAVVEYQSDQQDQQIILEMQIDPTEILDQIDQE